MRFASRIDELPPHLFVEISRKAAEKKVQGIDVISFGIGAAPGEDTPLGTIKWLTKPKSIAGRPSEQHQGRLLLWV